MLKNKNIYLRKAALSSFLLSLLPVMGADAVESALDSGYSGLGLSTYGPRIQAIGRGASTGGEEDDDASGTFFYPAVGVGVSTDDNINRTPDHQQSATIYHLRPALGIQTGKSSTRFNAGYIGNYGKYTGTNFDDLYSYDDHNLYAGVSGYGKKSSYNVIADYLRGHDSLSGGTGAVSIDNTLRRFDKWDRYSLLGSTDLGARGARVNLRLDGLLQNNRQDKLKSLDYDTAALGAMLKLRIGGKTYGVLEGGWRDWDYINSNADADRYYARLGVSWEATAKTKGLLSYGTEKYNPDNPGEAIVSDEPGPTFGSNEKTKNSTWQGNIDWELRLRDMIRFGTYKGSRNSSGTGSHRVSTRYTIGWTHDWSDRIRSNLGYMDGTDDYKGTDRNDDLTRYNFDLSYKFRRNMLLRGHYIFEDLDSNVELVSYDRNRFGLFFEWEY
ncbi:MAG: outer membrane beta-barrel protein [Pseudomonadota bacterium]|nr:outer membrane beta-barrel protein [Pseudomonadota bacterium]